MVSGGGRGQYREVADRIRVGIENGRYKPGELLPREEQLADDLGVHRATVNKALKLLGSEGLVRVHRGVGTFASAAPKFTREAFEDDLDVAGVTVRTVVAGVELVDDPPEAGKRLGAAVLVRRMVTFADDHPVQFRAEFLPAGIGLDVADVTGLSADPVDRWPRLAEAGHAPVSYVEEVDVRRPSIEDLRVLRMTEDQRVYLVVREAFSASGTVLVVTVLSLPVHRWRLRTIQTR